MIDLTQAKSILSKLFIFTENPYVSKEDIKKLADFVNGSDSDWTLQKLFQVRNMINIYNEHYKNAEKNNVDEEYKTLLETLKKPYIEQRNELVKLVSDKAHAVLANIKDFSNLYLLKRSVSLYIPNFGNENCFEFYKGDILHVELKTIKNDKLYYVVPNGNKVKSILFNTVWSDIGFDPNDFVYFTKINGNGINPNEMYNIFEPLMSNNINFDFL